MKNLLRPLPLPKILASTGENCFVNLTPVDCSNNLLNSLFNDLDSLICTPLLLYFSKGFSDSSNHS